MKIANMRKIDKGGLKAEFEVYLEYNNLPLFVIPGWKLITIKLNGKYGIITPRTLYIDYKTKEQKEGSVFKGRLNQKIEEIILNLAMVEYGASNPPLADESNQDDIPF